MAYFATATAYQIDVTFWDLVDKLLHYGFHIEYIQIDGTSTNKSLGNLLFPPENQEKLTVLPEIYMMQQNQCFYVKM